MDMAWVILSFLVGAIAGSMLMARAVNEKYARVSEVDKRMCIFGGEAYVMTRISASSMKLTHEVPPLAAHGDGEDA